MSSIEKYLSNSIPLAEAAEFLTGLKKTAAPRQEDVELMKECIAKAEKLANTLAPSMAGNQMGSAANGQLMAPSAPPPPTPAAMGQHTPKMASEKLAKERPPPPPPRSVGQYRGEAAAAARVEREKHRGGERIGDLVGRMSGAAAGAVAGHKASKGNAGVALGSAALGQMLGGRVGKEVGLRRDSSKFERDAKAQKKTAALSGNLGPDAQRYNDYIEQEIVPREDSARWAAHLVSSRKGNLSPYIGMGAGTLGGAALGKLIGGTGDAAGLGALGGLALGTAGGMVHSSHVKNKAYDTTLENQRKAHGIDGWVMPGRGVEFNPSAQVPEGWTPTAKTASIFKRALDEMMAEQGQMPQAPQQPQGVQPVLDPATQAYLQNEVAAEEASAQAHLESLRGTVEQAKAEASQSQEQLQQLQQQAESAQAEKEQLQQQVMAATNQAVASQDEVLKHQQASAAMRMAIQQMRGKLLEVASQDPPALTPEQSAIAAVPPGPSDMSQVPANMGQQAAPTQGAPTPDQGPAGQAAGAEASAQAAPPGGDQQAAAPQAAASSGGGSSESSSTKSDSKPSVKIDVKSGGEKQASIDALANALVKAAGPFDGGGVGEAVRNMAMNQANKLRPVLPHAAVGGVIGGLGGYAESQMSNDPLRQEVAEHDAKGPPGSLGEALNRGQMKTRLAIGEFAENHPGAATLAGALGGAVTGGQLGPSLVQAGRSIGEDVKGIYDAIKNRPAG